MWGRTWAELWFARSRVRVLRSAWSDQRDAQTEQTDPLPWRSFPNFTHLLVLALSRVYSEKLKGDDVVARSG